MKSERIYLEQPSSENWDDDGLDNFRREVCCVLANILDGLPHASPWDFEQTALKSDDTDECLRFFMRLASLYLLLTRDKNLSNDARLDYFKLLFAAIEHGHGDVLTGVHLTELSDEQAAAVLNDVVNLDGWFAPSEEENSE